MPGFRPAQRLIDLANAVREDPAVGREALAEVLAEHGETPADLSPRAFRKEDADELRAAVLRVTDVLVETDTDRAAETINDLLERCAARPRLSRHDGHAWHLHMDRGDDAGWGDWFTAASATALAQILSEHGRPAWGACAAPGCGTFFLGTGPGDPRRYCSPRCASRVRVAEHRRRKAADRP
ncbi:CGNR zinc finger domain-containing protein [Streptomyces sp. NBC_01304]|uniref:CGNR zinc finger domain-containing protein n=1 Tax=Streptomyces sp. NBC_01304 TaxID=2903818 RepID=UPI002E136938|nr:CGNR zinc finger domain-containing protein [Streptomyces sp. NBC_01304]